MPSMAPSPRSAIANRVEGGLAGWFGGLGAAWPLDSPGPWGGRFWWGRFFTARSSVVNQCEGNRAVTAGQCPWAYGRPQAHQPGTARPCGSRHECRRGKLRACATPGDFVLPAGEALTGISHRLTVEARDRPATGRHSPNRQNPAQRGARLQTCRVAIRGDMSLRATSTPVSPPGQPACHRQKQQNPTKIATLSGSVTPAQPAPSTQTIENRNTIRFRRRQNAQSGKSSRNPAKLCQIVPLCAIRKENLYSQPTTSFVSVTRHSGRGVRNVETPGVGLRADVASTLLGRFSHHLSTGSRVPRHVESRRSVRNAG